MEPHGRKSRSKVLIAACLIGVLAAACALQPAHTATATRIWTGVINRPHVRASVRVHELGEGVPILFIHGWSMDRRDEIADYEAIFSGIPGWMRLYPDLPGMGDSEAEHIENLDAILDALSFVVHERIGDRSFAIAGTSAGAYLADALASRYGEQVIGVLLRAPTTVPDDRARDIGSVRRVVPIDDSGPGLLLCGEQGPPLIAAQDYLVDLSRKERERVAPAQALAQRDLIDPIRHDAERYVLRAPLLPGNQPVLIMAARQDTQVGYRDAWRLVHRYPRATFVAIDRAEHGFPIDQANRRLFEALVRDWLFRVAEYAGAGGRP
jgi:pimeloyl-ACP methyl ester carboxylesterase